MSLPRRIASYVRMHGARHTLHRACEMLQDRLLHRWDRAWRGLMPSQQELDRQRKEQPDGGLISIAVPVYNTRPDFLQALCASLLEQTYQKWEAVLYDGASPSAQTWEALRSLPEDPRIRVIFGRTNAGISGNTNLAAAHCAGGYIALCDHDDLLSADALWHVARAIEQHHPDLIYTDEDKLTEDGHLHTDPHLKPDFCPDNLRSGNYVCHLTVVRRQILDEIGGLRAEYDGSQDHDLVLRVSERTDRIHHIPRVLYHWRTVSNSASHQHLARCQDAAARAVTAHMARIGYPGTCTVENGALRLRYDVAPSLKVQCIRIPQENRYQCMNRAAEESDADVLLFLDECMVDPDEAALREMLMYAQRDDVGAVTPMLTDARGRITHAGFTIDDAGRIVGRNHGLAQHAGGWHGMNRTSHNVMAVSAACAMIRKDHFIPFDPSYDDGLGAVDWCLKLSQRGLRHVYTPHARMVCTNAAYLRQWRSMDKLKASWPQWTDPCRCGKYRS